MATSDKNKWVVFPTKDGHVIKTKEAVQTGFSDRIAEVWEGDTKATAEKIVAAVNSLPTVADFLINAAAFFDNEANYPEGTIGYLLGRDCNSILKELKPIIDKL